MNIAITIDFSKPQEKYLRIRYDIRSERKHGLGELALVMPSWTPGSYLIRDFATHLEDFSATDPSGRPIAWNKTAKARWLIDCGKREHIVVTHRIYANDLSVRAAYADHEVAFANGPAVFLHPEGGTALPVTLRITTPKGWLTAFAKKPVKNGSHLFDSFDELYDTPILAAKHLDVHRFKVGKTNYRIATVGPHHGDLERLCRDMKRVIASQNAIFGGNPCHDYVFQLLFIKGGYGGLEHAFSSSNMFDGFTLDDPKRYSVLVALLAHEHFHLWNVKRIRPRVLGPFDYNQEAYTRELWIAEGVTSYYDDHTTYRANVHSEQAYLDVIAENIEKQESQKGQRVNSLSQSSFDTWIRHYKPNENSPNTSVSYYLKGGLVAMLLDFEIIRASRCRETLDGVMRDLFTLYKHRPEAGITREEFVALAQKRAGILLDVFFANYVDGVKTIDWTEAFAPFGIAFKVRPSDNNHWMGVVTRDDGGKVFITRIVEDSPAFNSDLQVGDEILALNGERIESTKGIRPALRGKTAKALFARRGRVYEETIPLNHKAPPKFALAFVKNPTPVQKKYLKAFLRR